MKKTFVALALGAIVSLGASTAYATTSTSYDLKLENLVDYIVNTYEEGYSKEDIVTKLDTLYPGVFEREQEKLQEQTQAENTVTNTYKNLNYGQFKKSVREGDQGDDVVKVQELINQMAAELGLSTLEVDGKFGPATARVVKLIQSSQGLVADGIVGPKTLEKFDDWFEKFSSDDDSYEEADDSKDDDSYSNVDDDKNDDGDDESEEEDR